LTTSVFIIYYNSKANGGSFTQYLKEDTRIRIISVALEEFSDKGYLDTSMRDIARNAGISIGNIYRYFKNKSDLFNEIIEPAYNRLLLEMGETSYSMTDYSVSLIENNIDSIMKVLKQYKKQLVILIDKSNGTKYEGTKEESIQYLESRLKEMLMPVLNEKGVKVHDPFVFYLLSSSFMDGFFTILRTYDDPAKIRYLARELIVLIFGNIDERFA
jgi:AcrR family transcriptional regulator